MSKNEQIKDTDKQETLEWIESIDSVIANQGVERAHYIIERLIEFSRQNGVRLPYSPNTSYTNTIPLQQQQPYPGNRNLERKIKSIIRWNAMAMVAKANKLKDGIGGHISSFASSATLYEVGFNHFFRGPDYYGGDLIFFQGHVTPGIYARSFLEGRLSKNHLENYRQELKEQGLSSYCHPYLMKDYWTFTTASMGVGLVNAVYQARFMKYLENRNLLKTNKRVWGLFGDGEMDEPESLAGLSIASREKLDNLTFVINCNLQRLDGPVRGNGQIIQELEAVFKANGWNVIKVLWGSEWDKIFQKDKDHLLLKRFAKTVDGKYQTLGARDGEYNLKNFFAEDPEVLKLVSSLSKEEIDKLKRGGHDFKKLYAAFNAAVKTKDKPTVILAKTKKGYGMGKAGESKMTNHQQKELNLEALKEFRDRFQLDIPDNKLENLEFYKPEENSEEIKYLKKRRDVLGGPLPKRSFKKIELITPKIEKHSNFLFEESSREYSTTTGLVRSLGNIMRDKEFGKRVVPIVADEARTFGMANLFSQIGIYSPDGQLYEPEDATSILKYQESKTGQLLEEGISEAGAISSWLAAATSYSNHNFPMMPFYIFYSMFGFQRIGDLIWAAADQMPRGFLIGATAGRTTLAGEGLQHQDGQSHIIASTFPNLKSYDPCFANELAVIFDEGMKRMMTECRDEFYYITVNNEKYTHPVIDKKNKEGIIKGGYLFKDNTNDKINVNLLGSGPIFRECIEASNILYKEYGIGSRLYSITSYSELEKDAKSILRKNTLSPSNKKKSYLERLIPNDDPIVATSDYVRAYSQLISSYTKNKFLALGTDGFGRSDTRKNLRDFFEVDSKHIVVSTLYSLYEEGKISLELIEKAIKKYNLNNNKNNPWEI